MAEQSYYPFIRVENNSKQKISVRLCDNSKRIIPEIEEVEVCVDKTGNLQLPEQKKDINWDVDYPMNAILNERFIMFKFEDGTIKFYPTAYLNCGSGKMDVEVKEDRSIEFINEYAGPTVDGNERQQKRRVNEIKRQNMYNFIETGEGKETLDDHEKRFLLLGAILSGDADVAKKMGFNEEDIKEAARNAELLENIEDTPESVFGFLDGLKNGNKIEM